MAMRPEIARNILIGLTSLVVLTGFATAGIVGTGWFGRLFADNPAVPSVMVLSRELLINGIQVNVNEGNRRDAMLKEIAEQGAKQKAAGTGAKGAAETAATATAVANANDPAMGNAEHQQALSLTLIGAALEDQLGGAIIQGLGNSGRFQPIPASKVSQAMADARQSGKATPTAAAAPLVSVASSQNGKAAGGKASTTGATAASTEAEVPQAGVKQLAAGLGADFTMVVSVGAPRVVYDVLPPTTLEPYRLVLSAQPVINCELFSNSGRQSFRFEKQFDKRISVTVALTGQQPNIGNISIAFNKISMEINRVAAQEILAWSLDKVAPARVMRVGNAPTDKAVINRGANDGVRVGAVYQVERETGDPIIEGGDASGHGGIDLGRVRNPVGTIVVQDVQDRIATVTMASGGPLVKGDIIKMTSLSSSPGTTTAGAAAAPGDVPLGAQALGQADATRTSGIALRQANVAVDDVMVGGVRNNGVAQLVSDALARDPRISILPRAQLGNLLNERALNSAATNDYDSVGLQGMRASGYLISGTFSTSTSRHANTVSVAGITRTVSVSTSSSASGVLRATSVDGKQVQSVQASGGSIAAAAQAAAQKMLLKLFPIKIVQVGGGNVYINRGQDAGVHVGAHLQLFHQGAPIVDPQTGAMLSEGARTLAGEAVVTDVQANVSTARLVGSAAVAAGDVVEFGGSAGETTVPARSPATRPAQHRAAPKSAPPADAEGRHF